ncbi:DUF763 domain-containing protein [Mucilaginibacter robiniae]|uniref:DUF763 domain-containing protein n=1 Tax=Mucilaginibacter robiniae TaxID=2728022 RepID=A0A7L5E9H0_9SPHI|nr:DUF763 domain-containing protein [Mucilaginibacter robiniae]QJD97026.1 DUF763 domain-containing protein [Mucilaginibacter robiniae]
MKRSGNADLPLHHGYVPTWLAERMAKLGLAVVETMVMEYDSSAVLSRLSNPFWFQSLGAVMGMDWHSSGITTSVLGALKRAVNPHAKQLGIYICGGKGKHSMQTPAELLKVSEQIGLNGNYLVQCSKLSAKVDNTAVQDGFQLYMHNFVVNNQGQWTVIQQGMNAHTKVARRYHWHSETLTSFVDDPHTAICGRPSGYILNMADSRAADARTAIMNLTAEHPDRMLKEIDHLVMPAHHDVKAKDVDLKRLGAVLWLAHEQQVSNFEELLLLKGLGPRTLQSLALVSEVIHGTPTRFSDPARYSFAHGGKDGHPFPVPVKVYDETINVLQKSIDQAKLGNSEKVEAIKRLSHIAQQAEQNFTPNADFDKVIEQERSNSWRYGGRTIFGETQKPTANKQLKLF